MDGNHKLRRLKCISSYAKGQKPKGTSAKLKMVRRSKRILNIAKKINKGSNKKLFVNTKKKNKKIKICNDLVQEKDSGCSETPKLGSYFCEHHSNKKSRQNHSYDGNYNNMIRKNKFPKKIPKIPKSRPKKPKIQTQKI
jgi:hypothetical protein